MGAKKIEKIPEMDDRGFMLHLRDLKQAYRKTYWQLRKALKECGPDGADAPIIKGAISDVHYAIEWLHTGRRPGNKRGIERRAAYQREKLVDPMVLQSYASKVNSRSGSTLTEEQRFKLEQALCRLSPQEREIYEMAHGQGLPHSEIASLLAISKGSVDKVVQRAQKKVSEELYGNLFLWESEDE
ncbi:sigma-70 family RNA polymerase sigma factor [Paenibacillus thailandensis]|uniref:Sigma-70 family RNA polymerase sigma factor n=1 Tax=Paenibacillus thailandensis TaxID=393250 RepID=A0ABW5R2N1_9BACL